MVASVFYDPEMDIAGVAYRSGPAAGTVFLGDGRSIEYGESGAVIGLEFERTSEGVRVLGLPVDTGALADLLRREGLPVLDALLSVRGFSLNSTVSVPVRSTIPTPEWPQPISVAPRRSQ